MQIAYIYTLITVIQSTFKKHYEEILVLILYRYIEFLHRKAIFAVTIIIITRLLVIKLT